MAGSREAQTPPCTSLVSLCEPSTRGYSPSRPSIKSDVRNFSKFGSHSRTLREEMKMLFTRRQSAGVRRRRDCKQRRQTCDRCKRTDHDRLSASSHRSLFIDRNRDQSRRPAGGAGDQRRRRHRRPADRADRHDTQSEPTKAVNGAAELIHAHKVSNFEVRSIQRSLAVVLLLARRTRRNFIRAGSTPTDPKKYPMCFRTRPPTSRSAPPPTAMWLMSSSARRWRSSAYTTGYGTASVNTYVPDAQGQERRNRLQGNIDAANPDLTPEILRMRSAGA